MQGFLFFSLEGVFTTQESGKGYARSRGYCKTTQVGRYRGEGGGFVMIYVGLETKRYRIEERCQKNHLSP